jgi:DUF1009 family protein
LSDRIGILAGHGRLPVFFAAEAKRRGCEVAAIELAPGADPDLASVVHHWRPVSIGCWQEVIDTLHELRVSALYLVGKVDKRLLYGGVQMDARFLRILASLREKNDNRIVLAFVADLEREGFTIGDQRDFLTDLLAGNGPLTKSQPTPREWEDIAFGFRMAKGIAGLDIGQTVVVKSGAVLAVEAIEGTDECIMRGGSLGQKDVVVVKVAKPHQDRRFDIPTFGLRTVETLAKARARVLAFEGDITFVMDRAETVALADRHGISLLGYAGEQHASGLM